ncbi:hypothetical protein [Flavobacterium sp.]|uniref:hypothetical protein n=1 Tax=Flavobacterium sp. TaxID=239 RepID=UPI00286E9E9F|nr:hypothetical protein [Flavobacterium sp.]
MELNKLETQFKEKLNSREIKPTAMAWDRLDAMLTVAALSDSGQVQKPKRMFNWLYIAASFIGFLLIATVFFNKKENTINIKKNTVAIKNTIPAESSRTTILAPKTEILTSKIKINQETNSLVQSKRKRVNIIKNLIPSLDKKGELDTAIQENQIVLTCTGTPENIDNLIESVEKNSNLDLKKPSIKINSSALLHQVDEELQVSFREKALNTITQKYKETREALVNRNNQ